MMRVEPMRLVYVIPALLPVFAVIDELLGCPQQEKLLFSAVTGGSRCYCWMTLET